MYKKIFFGFLVATVAVATVPMFAAFEAHVINVTAQIENALGVSTDALDFGTVFPQEHLEKDLTIQLSGSFLEEENADDVEYIIRQKPKCAITSDNGQSFDPENTATGHVHVGQAPEPGEGIFQFEDHYIDCGEAPRDLVDGETWGVLPSLCEYISKEGEDENDETLPSFHTPWTIEGENVVWTDVHGRLAKSDEDRVDNWIIDLAVPCFGGYCAQDWADFVDRIHPGQGENADQWTQPIENEHMIFGCDLWVEVTEVSRFDTPTEPEPEPGTITVTKVVEAEEGEPTIQVADFNLFVGAEPVDSGVGESFVAGSYQISETEVGDLIQEYNTEISCDDPEFDGTDTVTLQDAENIQCTITNTEVDELPPQL